MSQGLKRRFDETDLSPQRLEKYHVNEKNMQCFEMTKIANTLQKMTSGSKKFYKELSYGQPLNSPPPKTKPTTYKYRDLLTNEIRTIKLQTESPTSSP